MKVPFEAASKAVEVCKEVANDALAHIQQLESTTSQVSKALCGKENATTEEIIAAFDQVKRERDELLEIVRNEADCQVCKHIKEECDGDCSSCEIEGPCACARCTTEGSHWEWRGVKEETP